MGPRLRQQYARVLAGTDRSRRAGVLRAALRAASWGYGAGVAVRNGLYDAGLRPVVPVDARVISIGNITAGGTGKTPVTIALAHQYAAAGERVAILTRGYAAAPSTEAVHVVSDGEAVRWSSEQAGDEAWLLAERAPQAAVLRCADRVAGARYAITHFGATVLLLDDGFQHRRLARDEDWVLVDASDPWGSGALLPRGLLREPRRALRRATTLVISRADHASDLDVLEGELRRYNGDAPIQWATYEPQRLQAWPAGEALPLETLQQARVLVLSGIGNPAAFEETVRTLGAQTVLVRRFPDHHAYLPCDLEATHDFVRSEGLVAVVTTEKDAVRLARLPAPPFPLWVLGVDARLHTTRPDAGPPPTEGGP